MTEPYDAIEEAMGISAYMGTDHEGFAAVLKARFSDFLVHEVDRNGNVARLENLGDDIAMEESRKRKHTQEETEARKESKVSEVKSSERLSETDRWEEARSKLVPLVGTEASEQVINMLRSWEEKQQQQHDELKSDSSLEKYITMPELKDKDARRTLHELVRSVLSFCAVADTHEGRVRIWHKRFEKEMPNYGKFDRANSRPPPKARWPSDRPDFLQFVLYKENMDTSVATKEIVRRLSSSWQGGGGGGKRKIRIGYAGMKDKRGVTSQFCTLYRQEPKQLLGFNRGGGHGGGNSNKSGASVLRVGNFRYVSEELQLGALRGNRFDVVLRNVQASNTGTESEAAKSLNGEQRLSKAKQTLEQAAHEFQKCGFINYFGMQRFGKYYDTHKVGIAVIKGDFETAVNIIMEPKVDKECRSLSARKIWMDRFKDLEPGADDDKSKAQAESTSAKAALREMGKFMVCENAILRSLVSKPLDYKRAFCSIQRFQRLMFMHGLQSFVWNRVASFRINTLGRSVVVGDLVLTEDRSAEEGGSGTSGLGGKAVKIVSAEDVKQDIYSITDVVLPLVGTKIQYPDNGAGRLIDTILSEHEITRQQFGKVQDRELNLGGDYRKLICRPNDVDFEIFEYSDPLVPLIQTDLMKLKEEELALASANPSHASFEGGETRPALLGMMIGFTLPSSSYATIALRELMKRPTSSDYQSQLRLEGPCEAGLKENNGRGKEDNVPY